MSLGSEEMMEEFRIEMAEIAQGVDEALLRWERDPGNPDLPEKIFRQLHTLKGSSGFMELFDLSELCHAAEDVISAFRKGAPLPLPTVQGAITRAVGQARQILDVRIETAQHPHLKPLAQELRNIANNGDMRVGLPLTPTVRESVASEDGVPGKGTSPTQALDPIPGPLSSDLLDPFGQTRSDASNVVASRPIVEPPASPMARPNRPRFAELAGGTVLPSAPPASLPVRRSAILSRSSDAVDSPSPDPGSDRAPARPDATGLDPQGGSAAGATAAPRETTSRSVHHPAVTPRYSAPVVRRPLPDVKSSARKALRITQTGQAPPQEGGLLGSSLLGDHREKPGPLDPGALGPWSQERLNALKEGHTPASLRAAGQKQDSTQLEVGGAGRPDPLRRTPVQGAAEIALGALQYELEAALKRDPFLNLVPGTGSAGLPPGSVREGGATRAERSEQERSASSFGSVPRRAEAPDPIELLLSGEALPTELGAILKPDQGEGDAAFPGRTGMYPGQSSPAAQVPHSPTLLPLSDHSDLEVAILTPEVQTDAPLGARAVWPGLGSRGNGGSARPETRTLQSFPGPELPAGGASRVDPQLGDPHPAQLEPVVSAPDDSGLFIDRATTVRVDVSKLDTLLNLMGDLLQEKYRQNRLVEALTERDPDNPTVAAMASSHRRFERQLSQLQDAVLSTRMLPVQGVFRRYPRIVKDLAARLGKEVELVIEGEQTELDRALLEGLFEPLIHLLRNSIDHGIGAPTERIRANKPRKGTITLSASQEGNQIVLEIRDDGRGIDPDEMVNRAIKLKLLDPDRAKELNEQEKIDLIFLAGFTSRPEVTETSGRGVGMSVVRDHLRRIGGLITVQSKKGAGTTLRIAMPLTLAILQVLLVRVGKGQYAIPLSSVVGAWRVEREHLTLYRGGWYLPRPGSMLPLFSLSALLGLEPPSLPPERCYVAEVGVAEKRYGIWVTGFEGIYESVIKSLEGSLTRLPGVAGGTFIGTGDMVLVLDMGALLEGQLTSRRE